MESTISRSSRTRSRLRAGLATLAIVALSALGMGAAPLAASAAPVTVTGLFLTPPPSTPGYTDFEVTAAVSNDGGAGATVTGVFRISSANTGRVILQSTETFVNGVSQAFTIPGRFVDSMTLGLIFVFEPAGTSSLFQTSDTTVVTNIFSTTALDVSPLTGGTTMWAHTPTTYTATVTPAVAGIPVRFLSMRIFPPGTNPLGTAYTDANGVAALTLPTGEPSFLPMMVSAKFDPAPAQPIFSSTSDIKQLNVGPYPATVTLDYTASPTAGQRVPVTLVLGPGTPAQAIGGSFDITRAGTAVGSALIATTPAGLAATIDVAWPGTMGLDELDFAYRPVGFLPPISVEPGAIALDWQANATATELSVPAAVPFGTDLIVTAQVTGAETPDSGSVEFFLDGLSWGSHPIASGSATVTMTGLGVGGHTVTATFSGDATSAPSPAPAAAVDVTALPTTTELVPAPARVHPGQGVVLQATVCAASTAGEPLTGTLDLLLAGDIVASVDSSLATAHATPRGTCLGFETTVTAGGVGAHEITAHFRAGGPFADSAAALTGADALIVTPWATALTGSLSSGNAFIGDDVRFDVAVSVGAAGRATVLGAAAGAGAPLATGTVVLLIDGDPAGDPVALVDGRASLTVPTGSAGSHTVGARFTPAGDSIRAAELAVGGTLTVAAPQPEPTPEPTPEPSPESSPEPTQTPSPTHTPAPTAALPATGFDAGAASGAALGALLAAAVGIALVARRRSGHR
ncbi:Ig-like domain-containing protein [Microterricola pindariensis]|uniref:Ig-like domain-containing protein n=1 Tax=Microterricola pindariensis TaxID=478010 RepID=UPI00137507D3|nr:Ig-like domain-containing protein [Microterricola pindariensis]